MRLADDSRGRVPFSLVAALLLVTSAAFATAADRREAPTTTSDAALAAEEARTAARLAVERAVARASVEAARHPVVEPAGTPYGRALDADRPFRSTLRLRVALAVRDALDAAVARRGGVSATVVLPDVETPADARRAIAGVRLAPAEDGNAIAATVRDLTLVLRDGKRVVARERYDAAVTVDTPVIAVHDRVARFERRLDRGALAGPGLDWWLSAQLYRLAVARGLAQYGGAPIANVVANRHVALAANVGLLAEQRATFGRVDPATAVGVRRAATRSVAIDRGELLKNALPVGGAVPSPTRSPTVDASVGVAADRAFLAFVDDGRTPSLDRVLDEAYTVDARLATRVVLVDEAGGIDPPRDAAGGAVDRSRAVRVSPADVAPPATPPGFHALAAYGRRVVVTETTRWRIGRGNRTTASTRERTYRVSIAVVGRHRGGTSAPDRPFATVHAPGGLLDGPNLADVRDSAVSRLVDERGGADALAAAAVAGGVEGDVVEVRADRPPDLRERAVETVAALRKRVRALRVRGPARRLAIGTNPVALLVSRLDERRDALVGAPALYDGASERALVAVRAAYIDRVRSRLADRSSAHAALQTRLRERFEVPAARRAAEVTAAPDAVAAVRASPAYLTLASVRRGEVPGVERAYYPLAARNVNAFTVPYADASDALLDGVVGRSRARVSLGTAAQTLRAVNATLRERADAGHSIRRRRDALQQGVSGALDGVEDGLRDAVRDSPVDAGRSARRAAVAEGMAAWQTTHGRALAAANGSLAVAVADALDRRVGLAPARRETLTARLRVALVDARGEASVRVGEPTVARASDAVREAATAAAENLTQRAVDRVAERRLGQRLGVLPAGLPVAPVPGYWYATANVWRVTVRGAYARFAVRERGLSPAAAPDGTLRYVREAESVGLDVDGDGERDLLGRNRRVSFDVSTTVLVAVPPGPLGVGDKDGNADERSAGWGRRRGGSPI